MSDHEVFIFLMGMLTSGMLAILPIIWQYYHLRDVIYRNNELLSHLIKNRKGKSEAEADDADWWKPQGYRPDGEYD